MSICRRCARKQEPGSGGEHRDPGWLFRAYGEETRRSGNVPDVPASGSLTLLWSRLPVCMARPRLTEQQCCYRAESFSVFRSVNPQGLKPGHFMTSGTLKACLPKNY